MSCSNNNRKIPFMLRINLSLISVEISASSYHGNDEWLLCLSFACAPFTAFYSPSTRASWHIIDTAKNFIVWEHEHDF